jgi:hypothetical protein
MIMRAAIQTYKKDGAVVRLNSFCAEDGLLHGAWWPAGI